MLRRFLRRLCAGLALLAILVVGNASAGTRPAASRDEPQRLWKAYPLETKSTKPDPAQAARPRQPLTPPSTTPPADLATPETPAVERERQWLLTLGACLWLLLFAVALAPVRALEALSFSLGRRRGEVVLYGGVVLTALTLGAVLPALM